MATSMEKAFEAAEEQSAARTRVGNRVTLDAAAKQGRRIELLEVYASWGQETFLRLVQIVGAYMRDHGMSDLKHRIGSAEDLVQEAIYHSLRWPGEPRPDQLQGLVLWIAKRNAHKRYTKALEHRDLRLAQPIGDDGVRTLGDVMADPGCNEDAMNTPLELWYVERYIRDLLLEGRDDASIAAFLGVRLRVVEILRAQMRQELGLHPRERIGAGWTRERCICVLREYAAEHDGYAPTFKATRESEGELPTAHTLVRIFGSRARAFEEAGIIERTSGCLKGKSPMATDKVKLAKDFLAYAQEHGVWPGAKEISECNWLPSFKAIQNAAGGVSRPKVFTYVVKILGNDAVAGIAPPPVSRARIMPRDAATDILRWKAEHGRWPKQTDFEGCDALISASSARNLFGSIRAEELAARVTAVLDNKEGAAC